MYSSLLEKGNKQKSVQRTQPPNKKSRKSAAGKCKKATDLQPTSKLSKASAVPEEWKEITKSPIDAFKAMFFMITWLYMWQIKPTFIQCNMVKVIWKFWRIKLGLLLQFYCFQCIAKFHIEIFIGQMYLTHIIKQTHL